MSWRLIDDYRSSALADQITEFIRTQETSCMDAASFLAIGKKGLKYLTAHTDKETVNALILITDYGRIIPILHKDFNFHYKDVKELEALVGNSICLPTSISGRNQSVDIFMERFACGQHRQVQDYHMTLKKDNFKEAIHTDRNIRIMRGRKRHILPLLPLQKEYELQEVLLDSDTFELAESYRWLKSILSDEVCFYAKKGLCFIAKVNTNEHGFDHTQIGGVFTVNRYRNHGIAHLLVSALCKYIIEDEKKTPSLFVKKENKQAQNIYHDLGFEIIDSAKTVYLS